MMIRLFEGGGVLCQGQGAKVVQVGCDHNATSRTYAALVLRDQQQRAFLVFSAPIRLRTGGVGHSFHVPRQRGSTEILSSRTYENGAFLSKPKR